MYQKILQTQGSMLVEIILSIGLLGILLPALLGGIITSRQGRAQENQRLQAVHLLKEAEEVARTVRDNNWNTFAVNGTFHPTASSGNWSLTSGSETINGLTRSIVISDVQRNAAGSIVTSGGTVDPSTKRVITTITWGTPLPTSIASTLYLTRHENMTYTDTSEAQFNSGTVGSTTITNNNGGEIILGAGGQGDWCKPSQNIVAQKDLSGQGVATYISAIAGSSAGQSNRAIVGTGNNASGASYANYLVTDADPPVIQNPTSELSTYKANGVHVESSGYAYITTDTNGRQGVIMSTSSNTEVGQLNIGVSSANGQSVFILGNTAYLTATNNRLYTFNVTTKTGSHSPTGSFALAGLGTRIIVQQSGSTIYAYISISGTGSPGKKLQIINVTNVASMTEAAYASFSAGNAMDVYVNTAGTRAYLATASSSNPEFFIINTSTKSGSISPAYMGSADTGSMNPKGLTIVPGNRAIVVGVGGNQYQVFNISSESSPSSCGYLTVGYDVYAVQGVIEADGDAYSYIITSDSSSEFKIVEGGPGGQYVTSGTYESSTYQYPASPSAPKLTAYNRLFYTASVPASTTLRFQVAVSKPMSGSCTGATFRYLGPNGTTTDYFTSSGGIIPYITDGFGYQNPGLCVRYKAYLDTTDPNTSPEIQDVTINHSP